MKHWLDYLVAALGEGRAVVRVVVMQALGSTPREQGAVMLVEAQRTVGTIGGGELEWRALVRARELLAAPPGSACTARWPLGPDLGQCCGGSVRLWFERLGGGDLDVFKSFQRRQVSRTGGFLVSRLDGALPVQQVASRQWSNTAPEDNEAQVASALVEPVPLLDPPVWIFGAGHVGRALAGVLADLPFQVTLVDSRKDQLDALSLSSAQSLAVVHESQPLACVDRVPAGAVLLIMTHSHEIDYQLCKAALVRRDLAWVGLIGSETKGTCFRLRLSREGVDDSACAALVSPIGIAGSRSKLPAAIAVSVAAQLLRGLPEDRL